MIKDPHSKPKIGRSIADLLSKPIIHKTRIHPWLPAGLTLLAGKTKSGKSTLAEQIAEEVSFDKRVLFCALEYNERVARARFSRFSEIHKIHIVLEGEIGRMDQGGKAQFENLLSDVDPNLVIIDVLAKIKRQNNGHYEAEYMAMSEIKEIVGRSDVDCLVLTHSEKPHISDGEDPFDKIIGSTALQGVPDNLMLLSQVNGLTKLNTKGRLIFPSQTFLVFEDGKYTEKSGVGSEHFDKAPAQAEVLEELQRKALTNKELSQALGRDKGQISKICKNLSTQGKIERENRHAPWKLRQELPL